MVIGIEDDGRITGINGNEEHLNELLRAPFDFCVPSVNVEVHFVDCTDVNGLPNRVLVMHVAPSMQVHANQADSAFYRVGDKSKKLNFEMRMQLFYAKGGRYYEDEPVYGATIDDIDLDFVTQYCQKIGYAKDAATYLRTNKGYITTVNGVEKVSGAAILLFGKDPQKFFQRARIRIVRYLGEDARFVTIPQYPPFCWTELIVNAVAHRDYSILGTDIMVKIFDHHYVVESPGILPGMVRIDNIRQMHFSRNPKIVQFMQQYKLVKEFGEGVDRMFREMAEAGNPAPEYKQIDFMVKVRLNSALREKTVEGTTQKSTLNSTSESTLRDNNNKVVEQETEEKTTQKTTQKILSFIKHDASISRKKLAELCGITPDGIKWQLKQMQKDGLIHRVGPDKGGHWEVIEPERKGSD